VTFSSLDVRCLKQQFLSAELFTDVKGAYHIHEYPCLVHGNNGDNSFMIDQSQLHFTVH
jgi:hypothetical protein